jgi:tetratricopeptide (TPR) repeat protein
MMPFFSPLFLEKSVPPEILTRYLFVAVRSSRLSPAELADPTVPGSVNELLNGLIIPAKQLAPALYPEIASRLGSLSRTALNTTETRLAADERIEKASDQLEQLISEANSASDETLKKQFFFRAARLAKEQGQLSKAVDLAMKVDERDKDQSGSSWLNDFLSQIVSLAVKKTSPRDATYAISKMTQPLGKARAFRLLGEYYGANQDKVNSKEAFTQAGKQVKSVDHSNEKVRASLLLAESVLKYEPADAYEVFREAVKAINNLPSPEKDQEKMYYVHLLPVAEDLIRSFSLLATRENQTATSLAAEIKLSELRLAALSGVYSGHEVIADKKSNQD